MTVFDRLRRAMETAQAEQDLPDFLARDISAILQRREDFEGREDELDDLVEKVTMYDTYGQTGYLGMGVNHVILQRTLEKLRATDAGMRELLPCTFGETVFATDNDQEYS